MTPQVNENKRIEAGCSVIKNFEKTHDRKVDVKQCPAEMAQHFAISVAPHSCA